MASFIFENGSQADAANFKAGETLAFNESTPGEVVATYTAAAGLQAATITLAVDGKELTFAADALSAGNITFDQGGELAVGTGAGDTLTVDNALGGVVYGFDGVDDITLQGAGTYTVYGGIGGDTVTVDGGSGSYVINGEAGDDTIDADDLDAPVAGVATTTLNGGAGADTITGSDFVDYIFGNSQTTVQGAVDGIDNIDGGDGNDRIQGNAGNDILNGGDGRDYIQGGADNDTIDGDDNNDTINGNKGNDNITGDGGDDLVRGGQGADTVNGGDGQDEVRGDLGADVINGEDGTDLLFGGEGADRFIFNVDDVDVTTVTIDDEDVDFYETIADFEHGIDKIDIEGHAPGDDFALVKVTTAVYTDFAAAQAAAELAFDAAEDDAGDPNGAAVVAVRIGDDTYLFYAAEGESGTGDDLDTVIRLAGVTDLANITTSDFV